jgi:type IV secretory pathway VirB6-like protein
MKELKYFTSEKLTWLQIEKIIGFILTIILWTYHLYQATNTSQKIASQCNLNII